jgi:hypothetical protein
MAATKMSRLGGEPERPGVLRSQRRELPAPRFGGGMLLTQVGAGIGRCLDLIGIRGIAELRGGRHTGMSVRLDTRR